MPRQTAQILIIFPFRPNKSESRDVAIACPFEPQRIVVDLDAKVL
jgi:hypothetical protein